MMMNMQERGIYGIEDQHMAQYYNANASCQSQANSPAVNTLQKSSDDDNDPPGS
jgi:hypothetical protein